MVILNDRCVPYTCNLRIHLCKLGSHLLLKVSQRQLLVLVRGQVRVEFPASSLHELLMKTQSKNMLMKDEIPEKL